MADASRLWNYHLHYFDDLVSQGFEDRRKWHLDLIRDWIGENPVGVEPAWEPYPISRRIENWIKADLTEPILDQGALDSLAVQVRYLSGRCEHHLQGNHLWVNAKALVFAGLFFGGRCEQGEAAQWLAAGFKIAEREFAEQVRPDGSQFEQSPMYHALMVEDALDLINIGRAFGWTPLEAWRPTVSSMLGYLTAAAHPDGQLSLFNDAALNVALAPQALHDYARRLGFDLSTEPKKESGSKWFPDSGLVRIQKGPWTLLADTGPIGPDHIPGHAHADSLTFELSCDKQRLIVDTGTGLYSPGKERSYQRSTAAHNTVRVDGLDSSEVWDSFRVARRAKPIGLAKISSANGLAVCMAGHDGYTRLPGHVIHKRTFRVDNGSIFIEDDIAGQGTHDLELLLHFHPDVVLEKGEEEWRAIDKASGTLRVGIRFEGIDEVRTESCSYSPEFGRFLPAVKLVARRRSTLPCILTTVITREHH